MFLIIKKLVTKVIFLYYIDVFKTFINHLKKLYNISNIDMHNLIVCTYVSREKGKWNRGKTSFFIFLIIKKLVTKVIFLYYIDVSKTFINHFKKLYNISNIDKTKISRYNGNRYL